MIETRTYYYARVSTSNQNLDRQMKAFRDLGADERNIVTDKESGKNFDRAGYQALKTTMLRTGDTLVITSLDRLSRSKGDIQAELKWFKEHGIRLKVIDLPTTMLELPENQSWVFEMVNNILIEVMGTIAGKRFGRPALPLPENWQEVYGLWTQKKITAKKAMELTGLKRTHFYKMIQNQNKDD